MPITETLKETKIEWTQKDVQTIQLIKNEIYENQLLTFPDFSKPFSMLCDASDTGIGAILQQGKNIIGLYSKKLNPAEKNYSIVEKEACAVVMSLPHFRKIILCSTIEVFTDNRNCTFDKPLTESRMAIWRLLTTDFDYKITHIPGFVNNGADFLSRTTVNAINNNPFSTKALKEKFKAIIPQNHHERIKIPLERANNSPVMHIITSLTPDQRSFKKRLKEFTESQI